MSSPVQSDALGLRLGHSLSGLLTLSAVSEDYIPHVSLYLLSLLTLILMSTVLHLFTELLDLNPIEVMWQQVSVFFFSVFGLY